MVVDGVFVNALSVQNKVFQGELKALNRVTEIPKPSVIYKKMLGAYAMGMILGTKISGN